MQGTNLMITRIVGRVLTMSLEPLPMFGGFTANMVKARDPFQFGDSKIA
jgi:hypothetical protein